MNTMKRIDIAVGVGLCVLSTTIFIYADRYRGAGVSEYGPNIFPQFLAILMFIAAAVMIIRAVRGAAMHVSDRIDRAGFVRAAVALGIAVAYLLSMQILGFFLPTAVFLYVIMTFIGHTGRVVRVASCLGVTTAIYSIFAFFLKVPLPRGLFDSLI